MTSPRGSLMNIGRNHRRHPVPYLRQRLADLCNFRGIHSREFWTPERRIQITRLAVFTCRVQVCLIPVRAIHMCIHKSPNVFVLWIALNVLHFRLTRLETLQLFRHTYVSTYLYISTDCALRTIRAMQSIAFYMHFRRNIYWRLHASERFVLFHLRVSTLPQSLVVINRKKPTLI